MNNKRNKYRRTIEIYFVLYLAALIFIIPKPGEDKKINGTPQSSIELPFAIRPERSVLFCRLTIDSLQTQVIHLDSINNIFYTGDVENIKYEFIVEDQVYKHRVKLISNSENNNSFFQVYQNNNDNSAIFKWHPPLIEQMNKSYIVYVNATADEISTKSQIVARSQFILVVNYYDKETGLPTLQKDIDEVSIAQTQSIESTPILSDFTLSLRSEVVQSIAYQDWENFVFILGGLNPLTDLLKNPELKVSHQPEGNGGSAYIANYYSNGILLKGKSPAYGSINVSISIKRRYDNREASITFPVTSQAIGNPEFPKEMYPGVTYQIRPNLPIIAGQEIKTLIRDGDRVKFQSQSGEAFSFTPDISDTGKTLTLERYINGNIVGQRFRINIQNYRPPTIAKFTKTSAASVTIQTIAYGYTNNRPNTVDKIEIIGNAVAAKELIGQYREDKRNNIWIQYFEITIKDPSKPFEFKATARDNRGNRSETEAFDGS